jgi:hypothetical protein
VKAMILSEIEKDNDYRINEIVITDFKNKILVMEKQDRKITEWEFWN